MSERLDQVRDFFASGGSICPFARKYVGMIGFANVPERYRLADIGYPVLDLVRAQDLAAATYVFNSDMRTHDEECSRSIRFFKDILRLLITDEHGPLRAFDIWPQLERKIDQDFSPQSDKDPMLAYNEKPLFSFAMNPLYPQEHPRWAPCSSFIITRFEDVASVPEPIRRSIRDTMRQRTGSVYDADALYLMP